MQSKEKIYIVILSVGTSLFTALILIGVAVGVVAVNKDKLFGNFMQSYIAAANSISTTSPQSIQTPFANMPIDEAMVVSAVKKTSPAVVSIVIQKNISTGSASPFDLFNNDFFGGMFSLPQSQGGTQPQEIGGGSGFLVSSDGYIVTNRHVVADKTAEYTVYMNDGKKFKATIIATDPILDVAIIKIPGNGFPSLSFGNSDTIQVGQTAIAIGNALAEFRNTVSVGVISGLARSIVAGDVTGQSEVLDEVIQTDAAINPGNSGGPLLDLNGNVIGVNVAVAQGSQNIGFALLGNSVKEVVDSVKATGKIVRPFLGVRFLEITPDIQTEKKLPVDHGALVVKGSNGESAVVSGSAAADAGIVENDIILELNGITLDDTHKLSTLIRDKKVGDKITLGILHNGVKKTVTVTLKVLPTN